MIKHGLWAATWLVPLLMGGSVVKAQENARYDASSDPFYRKHPITVTWVMIWIGSTEGWWRPDNYNGCKVLVDDVWQSINWNDEAHIDAYCEAIRDAGIDAIAVDFTNGFRWQWQARRIQQFCHANDMKFTIAFNPQGGRQMESGCRRIWEEYASPATPFHEAYLHKDGKPLVVLYTTRAGYQASIAIEDVHRRKFTTVWASGEDSAEGKWGWQLDPRVGPVPSTDAMFVTGSVKWSAPGTGDRWRKHLSWLDYGFMLAGQSEPKHLVVGSYDDLRERNAWRVADTEHAMARGMQLRDRAGALRPDAYSDRVRDWLKGAPSTVAGGLIPDGAYVVRNSAGHVLGAEDSSVVGSAVTIRPYGEGVEDLVWFYHLGDNIYRLIKLNAALAFEADGSRLHLNWDSEGDEQRWHLTKAPAGAYGLMNRASREMLSHDGETVLTEHPAYSSPSQHWTLVPQVVIGEARK